MDDLSNYKLQLQQVEFALLSDTQNTELLKLKDDIGREKKNCKFWCKQNIPKRFFNFSTYM